MSAIQTQPPYPDRISVDHYHAMVECGILTADDPVELLEGVLVFKMPKKPIHRIATERVRELLAGIIPHGWSIMSQEPVTLSDGEPEPDGVVFQGVSDDYHDRHPGPAEVSIVIEVADSTLKRDRGIKLRSYARAGIPIYWIVNLIDRAIEVYTDPDPQAQPEPAYRAKAVYESGVSIPVTIAGQKVGEVKAEDILP